MTSKQDSIMPSEIKWHRGITATFQEGVPYGYGMGITIHYPNPGVSEEFFREAVNFVRCGEFKNFFNVQVDPNNKDSFIINGWVGDSDWVFAMLYEKAIWYATRIVYDLSVMLTDLEKKGTRR